MNSNVVSSILLLAQSQLREAVVSLFSFGTLQNVHGTINPAAGMRSLELFMWTARERDGLIGAVRKKLKYGIEETEN
jgi:hypothetical protein